MSAIKEKIKNFLPSKRKLMQLYFALLFNANIQNFATGAINKDKTKLMCAPGINCYSCPGAVTACPLGSLQASFSSTNHSSIYYVGGILLLYCVLFGRMICGWACPFGLIGELLYKIKSPKLKKSPVTRILSFFKYVVLVFFVLIVPIAYGLRNFPLPAFCKYICPVGTIEGGLGLLSNIANESKLSYLSYLFTWKFILMISIVVGSVFIFRLFCRFICPLGALYGLFNKISVFGVKVDKKKCTQCNLCVAQCKVDIKHVGDQECISCGECISVCPTKAISWKGPKIFLKANELPADATAEEVETAKKKQEKARLITRICTTVVLLAVLIGTVIYFWDPNVDLKPNTPTQPSYPTASDPSGPAVGSAVGNLCPSVELDILTSDGVTTETIDPTKTGKVTIINFWGTWCGPCKAELPYFDQIASEYAGKVDVIAIHSAMGIEDGPAYIKENYPNSKITFAVDSEHNGDSVNGKFFTLLGFSDAYPATVVLDENGVIYYTGPTTFHSADELRAVLPEIKDSDSSTGPEVGSAVGNQCPSVDLTIVTGDEVTTETINPTKTGKVTIVNFWGTWCGPCKAELPYFDQIASEYADKVDVIAIHSVMGIDDGPAYIKENYPDSKIIFAMDSENNGDTVNGKFFSMLGFSDAYPATIVLDENGVIYYTGPTTFHSAEELLAVLPDSVKGDNEVDTPTDPVEDEPEGIHPAIIAFAVMAVLGIGATVAFLIVRKKTGAEQTAGTPT